MTAQDVILRAAEDLLGYTTTLSPAFQLSECASVQESREKKERAEKGCGARRVETIFPFLHFLISPYNQRT
jgi:hypothetical protein